MTMLILTCDNTFREEEQMCFFMESDYQTAVLNRQNLEVFFFFIEDNQPLTFRIHDHAY